MNLELPDRDHLEAILLDPPTVSEHSKESPDPFNGLIPETGGERCRRLRHVLAAAHELLTRVAAQSIVGRPLLDSPTLMKDFLSVYFAGAERESFAAVFLDVRLRVIATEEMFLGTIRDTAVSPREIARRALQHNAAALVCARPHPSSGDPEPSPSDLMLSTTLKEALALLDIRLVDHVIVAGKRCVSLAERGLL